MPGSRTAFEGNALNLSDYITPKIKMTDQRSGAGSSGSAEDACSSALKADASKEGQEGHDASVTPTTKTLAAAARQAASKRWRQEAQAAVANAQRAYAVHGARGNEGQAAAANGAAVGFSIANSSATKDGFGDTASPAGVNLASAFDSFPVHCSFFF